MRNLGKGNILANRQVRAWVTTFVCIGALFSVQAMAQVPSDPEREAREIVQDIKKALRRGDVFLVTHFISGSRSRAVAERVAPFFQKLWTCLDALYDVIGLDEAGRDDIRLDLATFFLDTELGDKYGVSRAEIKRLAQSVLKEARDDHLAIQAMLVLARLGGRENVAIIKQRALGGPPPVAQGGVIALAMICMPEARSALEEIGKHGKQLGIKEGFIEKQWNAMKPFRDRACSAIQNRRKGR